MHKVNNVMAGLGILLWFLLIIGEGSGISNLLLTLAILLLFKGVCVNLARQEIRLRIGESTIKSLQIELKRLQKSPFTYVRSPDRLTYKQLYLLHLDGKNSYLAMLLHPFKWTVSSMDTISKKKRKTNVQASKY